MTSGSHLGRVAAGLQQRQHQGRELVAHRDGGKAHAHVGADAADGTTAGARPAVQAQVTLSDSAAMSSSSSRISAEAGRSSSEATSSTAA
jgi:hypothetical protein